jgi:hypothetical protein
MQQHSHSIRSSAISGLTEVKLRNAPSSLQEEIHFFLEGRNILDMKVSQPIRSLENRELQSGKLFVSQRPSSAFSGFLILRNDSPVIYWDQRNGRGYLVKLTINRRNLERSGSIVLSVSLYKNEQQMIIEDVIWYNNKNMWNENTFTERWALIKNINKDILRPDPNILGFEMKVVKFETIEQWLKRTDYSGTFMWEFTPDRAHTRRFLWQPPQKDTPRPVVVEVKPKPKPIPTNQPYTTLIATAEKDTITNLPDSYILYAADRAHIGTASVRKLTVSLALRAALADKSSCSVHVQWAPNFKKYEVIEIVDATPIPLAAFQEKEHTL